MREIATVFVHPLIVRKKTGSKNMSIPTIFSFKLDGQKMSRMDIKNPSLIVAGILKVTTD